MRLYIDIGNSNIHIGKGNGEIAETYRYKTDHTKSSDEYYTLLKHLFEGVNAVIIASVVPQLNTAFKTFITQYYGITPVFVGPGVKTGIEVKTDYPKEVGADLVAAAAGAVSAYHKNAIIIDMGTATTFSYVEKNRIKGVSITIGLDTSKDALVSRTSQLLQFEFEKPKHVLGTNTIEALNSGFLYGHAHQVMGFVEAIKKAYSNDDVAVILTGGASKLIKELMPEDYIHDELLILRGLVSIYERNKG
ncbi:MAG: type III pantothenate kinase [Bacillota bacterium]